MSKITEKVLNALEEESKMHNDDPNLEYLRSNYLKMKELGVIEPQKYNIPPLDTVGKRRYQNYTRKYL